MAKLIVYFWFLKMHVFCGRTSTARSKFFVSLSAHTRLLSSTRPHFHDIISSETQRLWSFLLTGSSILLWHVFTCIPPINLHFDTANWTWVLSVCTEHHGWRSWTGFVCRWYWRWVFTSKLYRIHVAAFTQMYSRIALFYLSSRKLSTLNQTCTTTWSLQVQSLVPLATTTPAMDQVSLLLRRQPQLRRLLFTMEVRPKINSRTTRVAQICFRVTPARAAMKLARWTLAKNHAFTSATSLGYLLCRAHKSTHFCFNILFTSYSGLLTKTWLKLLIALA